MIIQPSIAKKKSVYSLEKVFRTTFFCCLILLLQIPHILLKEEEP